MSLRTLLDRFDADLLRPPVWAPQAGAAPAPTAEEAALIAWCQQGAGPGGALWWQPLARTPVTIRLALRRCSAAEMAAATSAALWLDGSHALAECRSTAARLTLRATVKWSDACWWRPHRLSDPWDAGHLIDGPDLLARAARFRPRRATLILASGLDAPQAAALMAVLAPRSVAFEHPVRVLISGA